MVEQRMLVVMGATMAFVGGIRAINAYLPIYLENRGHNLDMNSDLLVISQPKKIIIQLHVLLKHFYFTFRGK